MIWKKVIKTIENCIAISPPDTPLLCIIMKIVITIDGNML